MGENIVVISVLSFVPAAVALLTYRLGDKPERQHTLDGKFISH